MQQGDLFFSNTGLHFLQCFFLRGLRSKLRLVSTFPAGMRSTTRLSTTSICLSTNPFSCGGSAGLFQQLGLQHLSLRFEQVEVSQQQLHLLGRAGQLVEQAGASFIPLCVRGSAGCAFSPCKLSFSSSYTRHTFFSISCLITVV